MSTPRIHFLGTGTAFNHDGRGSASLLVEPAAGPSFLVDAGPTLTCAMARLQIDPSPIGRLFVTHLHGDHVAGWPFLLLHFVFLARRTEPFDVHGPHGTRECLETLARVCYAELMQHRKFDIRYHELDVVEADRLDAGSGLRFDVRPMRHHSSSLGFRFRLAREDDELTIAVSGDAAWCNNLERLAADTDLTILECTSVEPGEGEHLALEQIRDRVDALGARRLVLVHLTDEVAQRLAVDPIARVTAAYDGMLLPL
jgi:ribonuclease BN (tRNA processing enzyme)